MKKKSTTYIIKSLAATFVGFSRTPAFRWIIILFLPPLTGLWIFLTVGYDAEDISKGAGSPEGKFSITLPFELEATLSLQLDWDEAPYFAEIYDTLHIPGKVAVCISDPDASREYCAIICEQGVTIEKRRFRILRASLAQPCVSPERKELLFRTVSLLQFAVDYVKNIRYSTSFKHSNSRTYARLSHAPLQSPLLFKAYREASAEPLSVTGWLKFAFEDLRAISSTELYRGVSGSISHEWDEAMNSIQPLFLFGKDNRLAKFGVKKFQIDDYGNPIDGTVKYEVVEVEYNESKRSWNLRGKPILQPVSADFDLVMEAGLAVRLITYSIAFIVGILFLLIVLKRMLASFFPKLTATQEVIIRVKGAYYDSEARDLRQGESFGTDSVEENDGKNKKRIKNRKTNRHRKITDRLENSNTK